MQQLMTVEIAKTVPGLYGQDGAEDPTVYAHYFSCVNGWDWWLLEFDGTDEAAIATSLDSYKKIDSWQKDMTMTTDSFDRLQDIIENAGELSKRAEFSELVNTEYSTAISKEVYGL